MQFLGLLVTAGTAVAISGKATTTVRTRQGEHHNAP